MVKTWSITGNAIHATTVMHNYLPFNALMGTGEACNWSIQWINKQKSLIWNTIKKSMKEICRFFFCAYCQNICYVPTYDYLFLIFTFTSAKGWENISLSISQKAPTQKGCLVTVCVKSLNAFFTWSFFQLMCQVLPLQQPSMTPAKRTPILAHTEIWCSYMTLWWYNGSAHST